MAAQVPVKIDVDMEEVFDKYGARREQREERVRRFYAGEENFLVIQHPDGDLWGRCNSVEEIVANNLKYFADWLKLEGTDDLPYLEPWIGTGIYANAFGCEYIWRENDPPHVHYLFHEIDEVEGMEYPDWRKSPVMKMVLDCIDEFRAKGRDTLPIALTDTQSAFDTATLILDAAEFFTACYGDEDLVRGFTEKINDMIVEFSRVQIERIGYDLLAAPGHIMPSQPGVRGISISDDNLAVSSPHINELISLPLNKKLADEFGGLAVHSCGVWAHTMVLVKNWPGIYMVECALGEASGDPNPNEAEAVRDALADSGIILKVRVGSDIDVALPRLRLLAESGIKLVAHIGYEPENEQDNHRCVSRALEDAYAR